MTKRVRISSVTFDLHGWRKARHFTARELAHSAGLSPSYLSKLASGERGYSQEALEALALALDCTPAELLGAPPTSITPAVEPWVHPECPEGHYIRAWRLHRELTLQTLAAMTGMTHATLSRLERGLLPYSQRALEKLAAAIGVSPAALIVTPPDLGEFEAVWTKLPPEKRHQIAEIARILASDS